MQEETPTLQGSSQESVTPEASNQGSSGLSPNLAGALSYLLGFITGIIFLLVEKENKFVRFHAMQSTLTFGGFFVVNLVLGFIPILGWPLSLLLSVLSLVLWIVLIIKAFQGEEFELPIVGKIAREQLEKMR